MSVAMKNIAIDMFILLQRQLDAVTEVQGDILPATAEAPINGDLNIQEVSDVIIGVLGLFSAQGLWFLDYTCDLRHVDDKFKLVVHRTSLYGQ